MLRSWWVLAITTIAVAAIQEAHGADTSNNSAETEEVTVTAEATGSLTSISPKAAMEQKTQVPGSFTVKTTDDMGTRSRVKFRRFAATNPGRFPSIGKRHRSLQDFDSKSHLKTSRLA